MIDRTCMSYWFPLLEAAGLPVPRTRTLTMPPELSRAICMMVHGEEPEIDPREHPFFADLRALVDEIGTPCFLRTGQTSAKHSWDKSCFVADASKLLRHVCEIAEFSEIADFIGLPYDKWFVRELLPSLRFGTCPRYGNMPVAREFRFFVEGGQIRCFHPYWPLEALRDGGWEGADAEYQSLCQTGDNEAALTILAWRVSDAVAGAWSVDMLATERGWFVTDMAEAAKSYHWKGCPANVRQP